MNVDRTEVGGPLWKSGAGRCKFVILVEACGNMQGYIKAHGNFNGKFSWKLQLMEAMESSTSIDSGCFDGFHQLPCISMEASTNFHGSKSISTNLHGNFHVTNNTSTDVCGRKVAFMD